MKKEKIIVPHPVGTYLEKIEDGKKHVDQVYEYNINKNGLFVILILDVTENPRLSAKISLEELNNKWTLMSDAKSNLFEGNIKVTSKFFSKVKRKIKK